MKTKLRILALALVAGSTVFAAPRISLGISVGGNDQGHYAPPAYARYTPVRDDDRDRHYDNDRDRDHDRDRGYDDRGQDRGGEHYEGIRR